jgi:beta-galactosidase
MRQTINFDKDWYFHRGDLKQKIPQYKSIAYISAKTERYHYGPASKDYVFVVDKYKNNMEHKSERWDPVELPHDYIIEGIPDENENCALGFFKYDNAWYIKYFYLDEADRDRRITLLFEGVATHATVYLNGALMKHNFCGYNSFEVDITDLVKYGEEKNVLSVYVNTEEHEGWWYEGGGIYRHVWLNKTDLVSIDLWGAFAKPVFKDDGNWTVELETTVRNDTVRTQDFCVRSEIFDAEGTLVAGVLTDGSAEDKDKAVIRNAVDMKNPCLWSPDDPYRYTLRTTVVRNGEDVDSTEVKFGFRTVKVDPDRGLFVNGKHYKLKGFCGHADCGLMGKAVPDNIHRYKVQLMKEMGANAYRTSHYPQSEALMEALDANGFLVMDETRWFESTDEGKAQLEMLIKRDRNRPSVIFWSVGNEEYHHTTEEGRRICQSLMAFAHKLDDSRLIMTAVDRPDTATVYDETEVIGINYNQESYERVHQKYPNKGVFSSECCATGTTRGWYFGEDKTRAFLPAWDRDTSRQWLGREKTWKHLAAHDWILGGYQWIAFEHRGEAVWPRLCSQSGAIDLFMQKKDAYYHNQALWTDAPMVHLLPHWNFAGLEGMEFTVRAYTNVERVELFLNGESLGIREVEKYGHAEWNVAYTLGEIRAVAYRDGKIVAQDVHRTTGAPYRLRLIQDTQDVSANGADIAILSCLVEDEDGNEVPDAVCEVGFTTRGDCRIYSTGSDITEHDTIFKTDRRMRAGRISVAVKLGCERDGMRVIATAPRLLSGCLEIKVK